MPVNTAIEVAATLAGLAYVILLIRENIACWPFGIAGSLLSIYLFIDSRLYSEAFLYSYYVLMGVWGWLRWHRREESHHNPVVRYALPQHLGLIFVSCAGAIALGWVFATWTNAERPYIDACTTVFSFAATWMEVKKVLEAWLYWIVINLVSIWLYRDRALDIYALLICIYAVLSVWGYAQWWRVYRGYGPAGASSAPGSRARAGSS